MTNLSESIDIIYEDLSVALMKIEAMASLHPEMGTDLNSIKETLENAKMAATKATMAIIANPEVPVVPPIMEEFSNANPNADAADIMDMVNAEMQAKYNLSDSEYDYNFDMPMQNQNPFMNPQGDWGTPISSPMPQMPYDTSDFVNSPVPSSDGFTDASPFAGIPMGNNDPFAPLGATPFYPQPVQQPAVSPYMGQPAYQQPQQPVGQPIEQPQESFASPFDNVMSQIKNQVSTDELFAQEQLKKLPKNLKVDIDAVPFTVNELCIKEDGDESSMFAVCSDSTIGEWDVGTLLSESDVTGTEFSVVEFSLNGTIGQDHADCRASWSAKDSNVCTQVFMSHGKGALSEVAEERGFSADIISTSYSEDAIVERVPATSPKEALSFFPTMDIQQIDITIDFNGTEYTLFFCSGDSAVEIAWTQSPEIVATTLGELMQFLAVSLKVYAIPKTELDYICEPPEERVTLAGYYSINSNSYNIAKAKERIRNAQLNIGGIIVRNGEVTVRPYEG